MNTNHHNSSGISSSGSPSSNMNHRQLSETQSNATTSISATSSTGIACFLDLPSGSVINIDGVSVSIQRDDFVGISQLPQHVFHFITIAIQPSSFTTGFVLFETTTDMTDHMNGNCFVRRYDPRTEEVSSTLVVDELTIQNLLQQIPALEQQQRVIPYSLLVNTQQQDKWNHYLTHRITYQVLQQCGIFMSGQKVIPGCYNNNNNTNDLDVSLQNTKETDGISLLYHPIPIFDSKQQQQLHVHKRSRWSSHIGTKRFLQSLLPSEKTNLLMDLHPSQYAWEKVFTMYYHQDWLSVIGDIQFSFLCFVHLHCLDSWMHWRDLLCLLAQLKTPPCRTLIPVLIHQLSSLDVSDGFMASIEQDNDLHDVDHDENEGSNSIAIALERLVHLWMQQKDTTDDLNSIQHLSDLIQDRLGTKIQFVNENNEDDDDDDGDGDEKSENMDINDNHHDDCDDDDDGPVVVDMEEYEAAQQRNQSNQSLVLSSSHSIPYPTNIAQMYPILWAAKQEHEDLVMTCARALEDAQDVSLVREAAEYLQQVEAKSSSVPMT